MLTGPVFEFRVETVAHDEDWGFLVVVDGVADIDAHEHGVLPLFGRDDEVILVFEFHYPWREVH